MKESSLKCCGENYNLWSGQKAQIILECDVDIENQFKF